MRKNGEGVGGILEIVGIEEEGSGGSWKSFCKGMVVVISVCD